MNIQSTAELALVVPSIPSPSPMGDQGRRQYFTGPSYRNGIVYRGDEASRCKALYGKRGRQARGIKERGRLVDIYV